MFVDRIKVFAQAGCGGRGSVSFRREKFVPKGGPDGGDGGRGGDVILRADRHVDNLSGLFYEPIIKAKNGGHGMGKKMHGRSAPAKIVKVPVGTIVWPAQRAKPVILTEVEGSRETHPMVTPRDSSTPLGMTSEEAVVDLVRERQEFVLCRGGAGSEGRNPVQDLAHLRREIDLYDPRLSQRPWFVVANKIDLPDAKQNSEALRRKFPNIDVIAISAKFGEGIDALKEKLAEWLESSRRPSSA